MEIKIKIIEITRNRLIKKLIAETGFDPATYG